MFIIKKKNRSGSTSVVVVGKSRGGFRELKAVGVSTDEKKVSELCEAGRKRISEKRGKQDIFALCERRRKVYKELERVLKLSIGKVLNIAKTITTLRIRLPVSGETIVKTMHITQKHKTIEKLYDPNFWKAFLGDA